MLKAITVSSFLALFALSFGGCLSGGSSSTGVISCYQTGSGIQCLKAAPGDNVDVDGDGNADPLYCADDDDDADEADLVTPQSDDADAAEETDDADDDGISDDVDDDDDNDGVADDDDADDDDDGVDDDIDCDDVDTEGLADEARQNPVDIDD